MKFLKVLKFYENFEILKFIENCDLFLYIAWVLLNERVTVKKLLPTEPCVSRMLPLSYPIKLQLTYMKYNNS
jgi:hypothetical protein